MIKQIINLQNIPLKSQGRFFVLIQDDPSKKIIFAPMIAIKNECWLLKDYAIQALTDNKYPRTQADPAQDEEKNDRECFELSVEAYAVLQLADILHLEIKAHAVAKFAGFPQDQLAMALQWLKQHQKTAFAQYYLGRCFQEGYGLVKDSQQAFILYEQSAGQDLIEAKFELALYYWQ